MIDHVIASIAGVALMVALLYLTKRKDETVELKTCPLCGNADVRIDEYADLFYVRCDVCPDYHETQQEATEAWNKRR